jgi:hypothetical protein
MKTDFSLSPTFSTFVALISALSAALDHERGLSSDGCFDPAFQHWGEEAESAWAETRRQADAVMACSANEPEDHLLQRMAWLIRLVLDVDNPDHLSCGQEVAARHVRLARAMSLTPDIAALLHEAGALVDEIALQVSEPEPDPDVIDDTALHADMPGVPVFA